MKFWITLLSIMALFFGSGCSSDSDKKVKKEETKTVLPKEDLPKEESTPIVPKEEVKPSTLALKTTDGKEIVVTKTEKGFVFSGYEDKVVLVNFFATWCPPCKAEIPHLNNLQEKYKDNFVVISILLEENKSNEEMKSFIAYNRINFPITNSIENFQFAQSVGGVKNIPLMFLYDKKGNYATHYVGAVPEEMLDTDIKRVL